MKVANVRYCLDGVTKMVPMEWFKKSFEPDRHSPSKQYLVFYSPGDKQTPTLMLQRMSQIPVFESSQDLDTFRGNDASGYYRATVSLFADSIDELVELIHLKRPRSVPIHLVKESSFEEKQRMDRNKKTVKNTTEKSKSTKASCSKKGREQVSTGVRRQSTRTNVQALKERLKSMAEKSLPGGGKKSDGEQTQRREKDNYSLSSSTSSAVASKLKDKLSSASSSYSGEGCKGHPKDGMKDRPKPLEGKCSQEKHHGIEDLSEKKKDEHGGYQINHDSNSKKLCKEKSKYASELKEVQEAGFETNLVMTDTVNSTPRKTQEEVFSPGFEIDFNCNNNDAQDGSDSSTSKYSDKLSTENLTQQSSSKRKHRRNSSSSSEDADDCYVEKEKYEKALQQLKVKEAELYRLKCATDRLRAQISHAPDDEISSLPSNSSEPQADLPTANDEPSPQAGKKKTQRQKMEIDCVTVDVTSLKQVFERVGRKVPDDKIQELSNFPPGIHGDKPFVKLSAVFMWGSTELAKHSTGGRRDPKNPSATPRPQLDLPRLQAVQELLVKRVKAEQGQDTMLVSGPRCSMSTVKRSIGEKIQTLLIAAAKAAKKTD